ncbi:MAG: topoisomerase IV, partial [Clostridia bacterium]|nr:topoisomerase IV [Clostridia bacterium]
RTGETEQLESDIEELESTVNNRRKIKSLIIDELKGINKKYPVPRKTTLVYSDEITEYNEEESVDAYPVTLFLSRGGYFKKITAQSLRMSGEQKYKDGDALKLSFEATNASELLILTDRQQMYKARLSDFEDCKASTLGIYLPTRLKMDEGESIITMLDPKDYKNHLLFAFENGKIARVELSAYETKTNRKKLIGAYSDKSPLCAVLVLEGERDILCTASDNRALIFNTSLMQPKASRSTQGVAVMSLKAKRKMTGAVFAEESSIKNTARYRVRSIPAAGALIKDEDSEFQQISLIDG